jgi:predicted RecB family nuclease
MYQLTKSRIMTGLQCPKRLWFDLNDPIKQDSHIFHLGNRFGEYIRRHYGVGLDLTGNYSAADVIKQTQSALIDSSVPVIYEAAFLHNKTLVRVDVLLRSAEGWHLIEAKSSTKLKDEHIKDAAIQSYVVSSSGIQLKKSIDCSY